jgi:hypothetical protein
LHGQNPIYQLVIVVAFIKDSGRMLDRSRPQDQFKLRRCVGFVANAMAVATFFGELGESVTLLPD